ncbi:unnamed protein product [Vitrella brassicaformis CCMP3155]|uniref:AMP deaminase n=1 Tax=Vitrella brassicaformis (strain CCMP3155) TaxID=1169540 RepID=A0A0G4ETP1_VITBC|nr:unnamed protein product [Vitrella brassicaformis CCMP3155]|eukprot:CEM01049.1 unnamed protein product [Vitrella brassicaformis CCMP3155]
MDPPDPPAPPAPIDTTTDAQTPPAPAPDNHPQKPRAEVAREMAQAIVHLCKTRSGRAFEVYRRFVDEGYDAEVGYDEGLYVGLVAFPAHAGHHQDFHKEVIPTMKAHGILCPFGFFQVLMKIFSSKQMYDEALGLYDLMKQQNVEPDAPMLRCLINFAFACDDLVKVEALFAALKQHELPCIQSYTTLIRAYGRRNDAWAALKVLREMLASGVQTDSLVLNSVLGACVGAGQLQIAETLVNESVQMWEEGQTLLADIVSFNILSKGYAQKRDFGGALKTLRASERAGLQPNDISYNTVIDAAVRSKRLDEAWDLVLEMGGKGIEADKYTCSILIKGLQKIGQGPAREAHLNTALEYLKRLGVSESSRLHEVVSFCLMESCLHMKDLSRTLEVFRHIQQQRVKVSVVTYGNVMKALGQAGRLRECFELWEGLKHTDLEPTAILYGILLDACINKGDLPRAMQVFEEARSCNVVNTVMYTTILKGFARTKQVDEAMRFFHQMLADAKQGKDVAPDLIAFSVLIQAHLKKSPVLQYLFYLKQIGLAMSPLSNNALFLELAKNPFPQYFKIGMNVSLSTDDPLMFHYTDEPLLEEYSIAAHVWKMSNVDLCEIARLSVLMSNFEPQYKRHWLGSSYKRPGPAGNSARHTNLPNMRVQYRHDTLRGELGFLDDVIKYRDDPAKAEIAAAHLNAMINNRRANEDDAGSVHFTHTPFSTDYSPQKCRDEPSILTPQLIMPPGGPLHAQEDHHGGEWRCPVSPTMSAIDADRARPQRKGRTVSDHSSVGWATTTSPRLDAEQRPSSPPAMPGLLPPNTD